MELFVIEQFSKSNPPLPLKILEENHPTSEFFNLSLAIKDKSSNYSDEQILFHAFSSYYSIGTISKGTGK